MYQFEKWLGGRFPKPTVNHINKFKNAFPKAPDELVDLFARTRGGSFPRFVDCLKGGGGQFTLAINSSWNMTNFFKYYDWVVIDRKKGLVRTDLFQMGDDDELVPIFYEMQFTTFYHCTRKIVFWEDGEVGEVKVVSDSLDEFLRSFKLWELDDYERKSEIDGLVNACEDEKILALTDQQLRDFRSSEYLNQQYSILHRAIVQDRSDLVTSLLRRGFSPLETDAFENNSFHIAAECGAIECLKVLTKGFPNELNHENSVGKTAFEVAVERNWDGASRCAIWLAHSKANLKLSGERLIEYIRTAKHPHRTRSPEPTEAIVSFLRDGKYSDDIE
jgi:hypothetical protein